MTERPDHPVSAEVEEILRRLPLAKAGARLDQLVNTAFDDAASRREAAQAEEAAPLAAGGRTEPRLPAWVRQIRPAVLASAALLALAFGVRPLIPQGRPVTRVDHPQGLPTPQPPLEPVVDPDEMVTYPAIASTPGEYAANVQTLEGPTGPPAPQPIGLQQTFEHVQNDGVVLVAGESAYQRVRRQAVRRIVVFDPQTGQHVTISIPTQELMVRRVDPF